MEKKPLEEIFSKTTSDNRPPLDAIFSSVKTQARTGIVGPQEETPKQNPISGFASGVGKGIMNTVTGIGELGIKTLGRLTGANAQQEKINKSVGVERAADVVTGNSDYRTPQTMPEKIGFGVEQIAEFLAPSSKIAKLEAGMKLLPKIATEVGVNVGTRSLQQGKFDEDAKTTAIVSAIFPVAGRALSALKTNTLKSVGEKIQSTVIRPTSRDIADGFDIKNVTKYGVGGSLEQTAVKVHTQINKYLAELKTALKESNASVDLNKIYDETVSALSGSKSKAFGDINATKRVIENLKAEINEVAGQNGLVDLVDATNIKRGAGTKGSWAFGRVEPDASAVEKVYTTFYNKIKTAIEKAAPEAKIKEINKKIGDLIPISNAAIRRLPVEQRNNVISLTDSIGLFSAIFDPRALALIGANKLSKSGKFGQFLVDVANRMPKTGVGKRIFGK